MAIQFLKYFAHYIFHAKTRQRLLFLAVVGLFISSFALLVLQSTMGGLQHKLIGRSKKVAGDAVVFLDERQRPSGALMEFLATRSEFAIPEYELELLLQNGNYIAPVLAHGVDLKGPLPPVIQDLALSEMILGRDIGMKLNIGVGELVRLISPAHVDSFLGDIPRQASVFVDDLIVTDVPEVDMFHAWVRLGVLQNLAKSRTLNRVRLWGVDDEEGLREGLRANFPEVELKSWEEQNSTLVWALRLETTVMVFLFVAMTMLVSLCITSGLMIFFGKVKGDLASFWILGASKARLERAGFIFVNTVSLLAVVFGLLAGLAFLLALDRYGMEIMPAVFVDRKIPVHFTSRAFLISFLVPYAISLVFSYFSLAQFKRDTSYLDHVRSIG